MFQWYRKAEVCYAYLSDVSEGPESTPCNRASEFSRSLWFTRGWTLQELLAPEIVIFYNKYWAEIGTKGDLRKLLGSITGIQDYYLLDNYNWISGASVAQKMCWASRRTTTRVEDEAYSLMGLFGVHMPLLYGEGKKAFYRLQLEIIASSTDESIFAWELPSPGHISDRAFVGAQGDVGIFATSPAMFQSCRNILGNLRLFNEVRPSYAMTNQGLRMHIPTQLESVSKYLSKPASTSADPWPESKSIIFLNCGTGHLKSRKFVAIHVRPWGQLGVHNFGLTRCSAYTTLIPESLYESIHRDEVVQWLPITLNSSQYFHFWDENKSDAVSIDLRSALDHGYLFRKTYDLLEPEEITDTSCRGDEAVVRHPHLEYDLFVYGAKSNDKFRIAVSGWTQLHVNLDSLDDTDEHRLPKRFRAPREDIRGITLPSGKYVIARLKKKMENSKSIYVVEILIKESSAWEDCALERG